MLIQNIRDNVEHGRGEKAYSIVPSRPWLKHLQKLIMIGVTIPLPLPHKGKEMTLNTIRHVKINLRQCRSTSMMDMIGKVD
jgi:hypothetical protein